MTEAELDLLCINTIRTLSMDAVQAADSGHPGTPMALAPVVVHAVERTCSTSIRPIRSGRIAIASCCRRATRRCCCTRCSTCRRRKSVNAQVRSGRHADGHARRHQEVPPARQQVPGPSRVPLDLGRRDHDRPARSGLRDERRHGDGAALARGALQQARLHAVRLRHLRARRRRLHDGRRLAARRPRSPVTSGSPSCAGSTTTTTSRSKATPTLAFSDDVATRFIGYGWNVTRVGDANDVEMLTARVRDVPGRPATGRR